MKMLGISSKRRQHLIQLVAQTKSIIQIDDAVRILNLPRKKAQWLLWSYHKSGWLKKIKAGTYIPVPQTATTAKEAIESPLLIATHLFSPGYVGGWTAAHHWGFTDQLFSKTWFFSEQRIISKEIELENQYFILTHVSKLSLFGLKTIWENNHKIIISDPHRTLIDFAHRIDLFGLNAFLDVLKEYLSSEYKNIEILLNYAQKIENRTVYKRLGFGLEYLGFDEDELLLPCKQLISKGLSKIAPQLTCPRVNKRWNLYLPEGLSKHD